MIRYGLSILIFIAALLFDTAVTNANADSEIRYTPTELYDYEVVEFDNGFKAILNSRGSSPNVALRLVVGVGTNDYDCDLRELPHLVEHLMFTGIGDLTETDLDGMVSSYGGTWNASTYSRSTTYDMRLHSNFLNHAVILYNMMFEDTEISAEEFEIGRSIVHAEGDGEPGFFRNFFYQRGIFSGHADIAYREFVSGSKEWCINLADAKPITLEHINEFMRTRHVPSNMTLIAVGRFDRDDFVEILEITFGSMPIGDGSALERMPEEIQFSPVNYDTKLGSPWGQQAFVSLEYGLPEWNSPDRAAVQFVKDYLDAEMYDRFRVGRGLSYDPSAFFLNFDYFSTLSLTASVANGQSETAMSIMNELVAEVRSEGVTQERLEHLRTGLLNRLSSAYETNTSIADFYESYLSFLEDSGSYPDIDYYFQSVTVEDTREVAQKYLTDARSLRYISRPTFSYGGVASLALFPLLGMVFIGVRRRKRNGRGSPEDGVFKNPQV